MKVSHTVHHGLKRWRVTWRERGKTRRRFFEAKKAAADFASLTADELKDFGEAWSALPASARAELMGCHKKAQEAGYSVSEACRYFEQHGPRTSSRITLKDLCARFRAAKVAKNLRPESIRILGVTLDQFLKGREDRAAASITPHEISQWIAAQPHWGPFRRRGVIIDLRNLFSWAMKAGLVDRNPLDSIERPVMDQGTPRVFTVDQCARLLKLCSRREFKTLVPWVAVCLFAGIRPAEASRLTWSDIDVDSGYIKLTGPQTKGRSRRLVKIKPALRAWLATCKRGKGLIAVKRHTKKMLALRKTFGVWHRDVLRHSFVSYELAVSRDIQGTALEAGHSVDVLFKHYREVVTETEAKRFWDLAP